jgi:hypothetical protein
MGGVEGEDRDGGGDGEGTVHSRKLGEVEAKEVIYNRRCDSTSRTGTDTEEKDCQEINHVTHGHNYWNNNDNNTVQLKNETRTRRVHSRI